MHANDSRLRQANGRSVGTIFPLADGIENGRLIWWPDIGVGYFPVTAEISPYDYNYFDRFDRDARTDLGKSLMQARVNFIEQHYRGPLIDVGIGCGAFIDLRNKRHRMTYGYDINLAGIEWLEQRALFVNPYYVRFEAASLWDVLEHMPDFTILLHNISDWLFLSLPIFHNADHALHSKHFRPKEHYWYFTRSGLIHTMSKCGFQLVSESNVETELGREDIGTFAFRRVHDRL